MNKTDIQAGIDQMGFEMVDNGVLELPASTPATYEFVEPADYDPDAFEQAMDEQHFSVFTPTTERREDGAFYYYVDVLTDHYKKAHVRVWRDSACIFPKEDGLDKYEFARLVGAVESAFGELEHVPDDRDIPREDGTEGDR